MTAMLLQVADEEFCIVDCGFDLESVSGNAFVQYKALTSILDICVSW